MNILKNLVFFFLIFLFSSCCEKEINKKLIKEVEIPFLYSSKDVIIVNSKVYKITSWEIKENDIINTLEAIEKFFQNPDNTLNDDYTSFYDIKATRFNYRVQMVGFEEDGYKKIYCNFYPRMDDYYILLNEKNPLDRDNPNSRYNTIYFVEDGGFFYWRITYDVKSKKCYDFNVNGEA